MNRLYLRSSFLRQPCADLGCAFPTEIVNVPGSRLPKSDQPMVPVEGGGTGKVTVGPHGGGMGALTFALAEKLLGCTRVLAGVLLSLLCPAGKVGVSQVQVTGSHFWVKGH